MLTMTATESGSKELECLLAVIGARKDQAAFAALYSATKGKLFSTVLLIVKRSDLAEEIIQEAYVRIWHCASSYHSSRGSPMTWMITIARNLAIDMVRKSAREIYSDDSKLLELPADGPTALETIEASEDEQTAIQEQHNVLSALQALHPTRRDLVIAAYIHGESREQLSKRTGIPVNTIKTWIRRSLLEVESILRGKDKEREQVFSRASQIARKDQLELAATMGGPDPKVTRNNEIFPIATYETEQRFSESLSLPKKRPFQQYRRFSRRLHLGQLALSRVCDRLL